MKKWALLFVCIAMLLILAVPGYAETPPTAPTIVTQPVDPKPVTGATVTLSATQQEYDGSEKGVSVTGVTLDGTALTAGTDYDVTSGTTGADVGTYTVTVTGKGNYGGTATATWEIVPTMTFIGSIKWVDGGREHTTPPALTLYRTTGAAPEDPTDGTRVPNADPTWNEDCTVFTYAILREFDEDHNNYSYWVVEDTVDGYEAPDYYTKDHETGVTQETDRLENGGTVNNCIKQEKIKLTGIVTWEHGCNPGADRPKTATVHLQANGADLPNKVITLDGTEDDHTLDGYGTYTPADVELAPTVENTWRFVFTGLDKYDSTGAEVIYTVREEHVANYKTTYDTAQRDITNTYNTNTLGDILKVRKAVEVPDGELAWTWGDDDKFVFGLYGVSNTAGVTQPMPSGSVYGDEVYKRIEVTKDSVNQEAGFGAVSFDTPGTYVYCVREMTPAESGTPRLPGMTCDAEAYTVTAVVDSDMRISVTVSNKAGQTIAPDGNNVVTMPFTNRFDANKVACAMAAGMVYVDPSKLDGDGRPLNVTGEVSGEFGFTMRPVGDNAADAPMPSDAYSSRTECGLPRTPSNSARSKWEPTPTSSPRSSPTMPST